MKIEPSEKRRYIQREYYQARLLIRKLFNIPDDEFICYLEFDKDNSKIIIKSLKDFDKEKGDM